MLKCGQRYQSVDWNLFIWPYIFEISLLVSILDRNVYHCHDNYMTWKRFPHYWPFVRGIYHFPLDYLHEGPIKMSFNFVVVLAWAKCWTNSRFTGNLRHRNAHVMSQANLPLQWRQNGCDGVSNHQPHHCLLNRLFRSRSKKTSKLRLTGLCVGNSPITSEFPVQMASNAENVSV